MKASWLTVQSFAVPIEDAVGGVAVLLNLHDDEPSTDCMEATAWNKDAFACVGWHSMKGLLDSVIQDCRLKGFF